MKILLSIKPQFADKILSGEKGFEFRKNLPKHGNIETVVIYATKPVGKIVGEFSVAGIVSNSPDDLWETTKDKAGISKKFFSEYFLGRDIAHAFKVGSVKKYDTQINIEDFCNKKVPPQSFFYI
jgi:predicted transcriptional regulator